LTGAERSKVTLGDFVKRLEKGMPGIVTPFEPRICVDYPITYTNAGPFSSFAPQFDSTWASLSKRDSDLLTTCYGDQANASEAIALRQMVEEADASVLGVVDGFLDKLTDGEHSRTMTALGGDKKKLTGKALDELLEDVKSLENLGLDVAFVSELRTDLGLVPKPTSTIEQTLRHTANMVSDLTSLNYERLSTQPGVTLTDTPFPTSNEVGLAKKLAGGLQKGISDSKIGPGELVEPGVVHNAMGIADEDRELLGEFFQLN